MYFGIGWVLDLLKQLSFVNWRYLNAIVENVMQDSVNSFA